MIKMALIGSLLFSGIASAELILTSPPQADRATSETLYMPLAAELSAILGEKVVYEYAGNWPTFSSKYRKGDYDLILDEPHIAAWGITHNTTTPVAGISGHLQYVVIAHSLSVNSFSEIGARKVCGLPTPDLGGLWLLAQFDSPIQEPIMMTLQNEGDTMKALNKKECVAAVIPLDFYQTQVHNKEEFHILETSKLLPNMVLTASNDVSPESIAKMAAALAKKPTSPGSEKLLAYFGEEQLFTQVDAKDYHGMNNYLEGVVWGW